MIKPRNYALLVEYKSPNYAAGIVRTLFTFDTIKELDELSFTIRENRKTGVFIVLRKNNLINDDYDGIIEYLYNPVIVYRKFYGREKRFLATNSGIEVIQVFRPLSNGMEIPEGAPIIRDKDGNDRESLWELAGELEPPAWAMK